MAVRLQCKICGSFDLTQKDNLIICDQCGCKYSLDEAKNMISENISQKNSNSIKKNTKSKSEEIGIKLGCLLFALCIILTIALIYYCNSNGNNLTPGQVIATITKSKPTVTAKQTLTGIDFYIQCNDNYSYVQLEIVFCDKNDNIIKAETLTGTNYKKGNTYTLSYTIDGFSSAIDLLKSQKYSYQITKYE